MAPDVLLRKLSYLRQLLADLAPYENATLDEVLADHYKLERILEMLVVATTDILNHLLSERGLVAASYRDSYNLAAAEGLLPADLAGRLQTRPGCGTLLSISMNRLITPFCAKVSPRRCATFAR